VNPKLTSDRLGRRAVIYIRQSSPGQVLNNHESQRGQYGLADRARELGSLEAIRHKAGCGELQFLLPVGLCWTGTGTIEKDADRRVQQAIQLVFTKITALGSVRQVLLWFRQEKISLPAFPRDPGEPRMVWTVPI